MEKHNQGSHQPLSSKDRERSSSKPRVLHSCRFCKRKYLNHKALCGHQNAHVGEIEMEKEKKRKEVESGFPSFTHSSNPRVSRSHQRLGDGFTAHGTRNLPDFYPFHNIFGHGSKRHRVHDVTTSNVVGSRTNLTTVDHDAYILPIYNSGSYHYLAPNNIFPSNNGYNFGSSSYVTPNHVFPSNSDRSFGPSSNIFASVTCHSDPNNPNSNGPSLQISVVDGEGSARSVIPTLKDIEKKLWGQSLSL